jgi:hypothetical protein
MTMSSLIRTGVAAHDSACLSALITLQAAVAAAAQSPAGQVAADAAYVVYWRAVAASCKANNNGVGIEGPIGALRDLGTGGV